MLSSVTLLLGDCLERMKEIEAGSVDVVLADPPYGTTACKWDSIIEFEPMWEQLERVTKENAAICLFGGPPWGARLICSRIDLFRYRWVWKKSRFSNQMQAKRRPLAISEDINVFAKGRANYYPQGLIPFKGLTRQGTRISDKDGGGKRATSYFQEFTNYPRDIIEFASEGATVHPTQKPVTLLEYLIKTYTFEGETVLDFTMGSGSTGVACANTGRKFIGIEKDEKYFAIAKERIEKAMLSV